MSSHSNSSLTDPKAVILNLWRPVMLPYGQAEIRFVSKPDKLSPRFHVLHFNWFQLLPNVRGGGGEALQIQFPPKMANIHVFLSYA